MLLESISILLTEEEDTRTGTHPKWRNDVWTGLQALFKTRKQNVLIWMTTNSHFQHYSPEATWPYSLVSTLFTVPCFTSLQCQSAVSNTRTAALNTNVSWRSTRLLLPTSVIPTQRTWVRHLPVPTIYVLLAGCASLPTEHTPPAESFRYRT